MRTGDALSRIDPGAIAADLAALVRVPSVTGEERRAHELLAEICERRGLRAELREHDLAALRRHFGHPGEEASRTELVGTVAAIGSGECRLCINGHLDVVGPGAEPWSRDPFSGAVEDGFVHGRGSLDMKAGVVAAVHAMAAAAAPGASPCEVVLQAVSSEEDGGQGTFAALEADDRFDACLIPEPTSFDLVCAHAGALTFRGVVSGRTAHAAFRLAGLSAIDRYVAIHAALADLERELNADVEHPLMGALELPYPLLVGRVQAGRWSSQVPDRLEFEGRVGVPVGESPEAVRRLLAERVGEATGEGPPVELTWTGGQFAPGETDPAHPFATLVAGAIEAERGAAPATVGMPYGADMRLFTERGIPCVMAGPGSPALAHAVDEAVAVDEVAAMARVLVRVIAAFG
ncbi:MAG TPA: M20/M25/M40 family metallo-hydrolase [Thermoleophilaceae bacterium]|nr:M20/M25/M40 family metallo-hydrolase [Thermoleophilaceae bacterium]